MLIHLLCVTPLEAQLQILYPGFLLQEATPTNVTLQFMRLLGAAAGAGATHDAFGDVTMDTLNPQAVKGPLMQLPWAQVPCVTYFDAQLQILDLLEHKAIFTAGYKAILHLHSLVEECEITRLLAQVNVKTKEKKKARLMHCPCSERAQALSQAIPAQSLTRRGWSAGIVTSVLGIVHRLGRCKRAGGPQSKLHCLLWTPVLHAGEPVIMSTAVFLLLLQVKFVKSGTVVIVRIEVEKQICAELFDQVPQLGRFTLRDEGRTIAIGKIIKLPKSLKEGAPEAK